METHSSELAQLAKAHFGRRSRQPTRAELRVFYREAEKLLAYRVLWFAQEARNIIADAIGGVIERERLTCYACAILRNHIHILVRKHRLKGEEMSRMLKDAARSAMVDASLCPEDHPVFSADVCDYYKSDPQSVRNCIGYIRDNCPKHNLPPQDYPFVSSYDG